MKNFIKDTWVLALALIAGGIIVFNNASQVSEVADTTDTKEEGKLEVPFAKITEKKDSPVVLYKNDPKNKVLYDNDSEFAAVTLDDSVDTTMADGKLEAPEFDIAKADYKIPTVIQKREYKADHLVAQSAEWTTTAPSTHTKTVTVKPNMHYKTVATNIPVVSNNHTAEIQVVTSVVEFETIPDYLMPTPVAFDVPATEAL